MLLHHAFVFSCLFCGNYKIALQMSIIFVQDATALMCFQRIKTLIWYAFNLYVQSSNTLKWFALSSIVRCMRVFHGCLIVKTKKCFLQISYICQMSRDPAKSSTNDMSELRATVSEILHILFKLIEPIGSWIYAVLNLKRCNLAAIQNPL